MSNGKENNLFLKFACYLTFTNYNLLKECSEISKRKILKYFSGLIIICTIWFFNGFVFTKIYINDHLGWAIFSGVISLLIVLQIERQIIVGKINKFTILFRIFLGVLLAIIGSLIMDQIIFQQDIALLKQSKEYRDRISLSVSSKLNQINDQKSKIERERDSLKIIIKSILNEKNYTLVKKPRTITQKDTLGNIITFTEEVNTQSYSSKNKELLPVYEKRVNQFNNKIYSLDSLAATYILDKEKVFDENKGILDEIRLLMNSLFNNKEGDYTGLFVYATFFLFLLIIELFILVTKIFESHTDYDELIRFQRDTKIKRIRNLEK